MNHKQNELRASSQITLLVVFYLWSNHCLYFIDPAIKTGAKNHLTCKVPNTVCLEMQRHIHPAMVCQVENKNEAINNIHTIHSLT